MQLRNKLILIFITSVIAWQPCLAVTLSNEILFTAKKFILAMIGVVISSLFIYVGLTLYNKFFHNQSVNENTTYDENTLEPAQNLEIF